MPYNPGMPRTLRDPVEEQDALADHATWRLRDGILRYARAMLRSQGTSAAALQIGTLIVQTLVLADLLGRRRVLLWSDDVMDRVIADRRNGTRFQVETPALMLGADPSPMVTPVTFEEMIRDILNREPRLAPGYKAVQELYSHEYAFAVAKSVTVKTTERVQEALAVAARTGQGAAVEAVIAEIGDWSAAYAETVYRTNMATAYTAGQFQEARSEVLAPNFPALEYVGITDTRTRPNHRAAFGLIAATDDPIWKAYAPPLGYNDRCSVVILSRWELTDLGLYKNGLVQRHTPPDFAKAHADHGFTHSAVATVYR